MNIMFSWWTFGVLECFEMLLFARLANWSLSTESMLKSLAQSRT